jgi:hypothetical protein
MKTFVKEVLKRLPSFDVARGHFFFERPFEHVLAGFAWEKPPSGLYIWKFAFPIFDEADDLHLGYGERLPHGKIHTPQKVQQQAVAETFVEYVAPYMEQVSELRSLDNFISYLGNRTLRNPLTRRGYALSLILNGDDSGALEQLNLCAQTRLNEQFDVNIDKWIGALRAGRAKKLLLDREEQFLKKMEIGPSV